MMLENKFNTNVSRVISGRELFSSRRLSISRRLFLKETLNSAAISLAVSSGILLPMQAFASWNEAAFTASNLQTAIKSALGSDLTEASNKITIKAPKTVENGAIVPITVSSSLEEISTITLFSENNSTPLVAHFELDKDCDAFISTRIKMGKTSNVVAVVSASRKNYSTRKQVNVTIGGCGS
ncbi:MAG: thiosulfate oxidation carrier protein SoxY [Gammaproteobacteria bacterium]|nr:thiosulfate oxidation carrier protein SoxY [Gammaproteobacteria bacterium]